jgi:hypothetical protein
MCLRHQFSDLRLGRAMVRTIAALVYRVSDLQQRTRSAYSTEITAIILPG